MKNLKMMILIAGVLVAALALNTSLAQVKPEPAAETDLNVIAEKKAQSVHKLKPKSKSKPKAEVKTRVKAKEYKHKAKEFKQETKAEMKGAG